MPAAMYPSMKGELSEATPPPPVPAMGIPVNMVYPPSAPHMAGGPNVVQPPAALPQGRPWTTGLEAVAALPQGRPWTTGLCDCFDDCYSCCLTWWCPCIAFGQIAEIVDRGTPSCFLSGALYCIILYFTSGLCQCVYSCTYRSKLRAAYDLPETPCADCLVHCCCEPCALCQMYRELKNRGLDPALGWGICSERMMTSPPAMQGMAR